MQENEKQELINSLKNATEDVLSVNDMEKVEGGGIIDFNKGCPVNQVPQCGCIITPSQPSTGGSSTVVAP